MPFILLAILIGVPLLELVVIIKVGGAIGILPTILLLVGVGIVGTVLLRSQSMGALRRASEALSSGEPPVDSVIDGIGLLFAGALMLTPGFLTDILGLLLLIPAVRHKVGRSIFAWLARRAVVDVKVFRTKERRDSERPRSDPADGPLIEGEFTRIDDPDDPSQRKKT